MLKNTLFSYARKQHGDLRLADKQLLKTLEGKKPGKVLMILAGSGSQIAKKGFKVTVVDDDLATIQNARKMHKNVNYEYVSFPVYARRMNKNSFDYIIDNGFSMKLRRRVLSKFYKDISKLLKYDGILVTKTLSVADQYCREHCPKRRWTTIGKDYVNFFTKTDLSRILNRNGFCMDEYKRAVYEKDAPNTYHIMSSVQKSMKL